MVDQVSGLQKRGVNAAILSGNAGTCMLSYKCIFCNLSYIDANVSFVIVCANVDKELIASERQVSLGHFQLLYHSPEAILGTDTLWRQLLVSPPLSETVVAVAVTLCLQVSPNKPNITYEAVRKNNMEEDFNCVVRDVAENDIKAQRVVVYCQSLDMCASLYTHFLQALQDASYYPPGAEHVSDNRLFAMFHSCTDERNKRVVMSSLSETDGVVRVVFATMAGLTSRAWTTSSTMVLLVRLKTTFRRVAELAEITERPLNTLLKSTLSCVGAHHMTFGTLFSFASDVITPIMAIQISKPSSRVLGHRSTLVSVRRCPRATGILCSLSTGARENELERAIILLIRFLGCGSEGLN
ncbi:hypothetical protein EMCRGX_G016993 [Ephydatia muelleri]